MKRLSLLAPSLLVMPLLFDLALPAPSQATTWIVDPAGGGGTYSSLTVVPWSSVAPGDDVTVRGGTYANLVTISAQGTAVAPITVHADPGYARPVINNSVNFQGAAYVIFDGFEVANAPTYSGVIIQADAQAITVQNSEVHDSPLGVFITSGDTHRILNNIIHDNESFGIIAQTNASLGQETLIQGNQVFQNGSDGIAIAGNFYQVILNTVYENGQTLATGSSGIHLYSASEDGTGQYNIVAGNVVYGTKSVQYDGGGILIDEWCDNNWVYFNASYGNDGAGIGIFSGAHNSVFNNTLYDNSRNNTPPSGSGLSGRPFRAEMSLSNNSYRATYNVFRNNLIVPNDSAVVAVFVDYYSSVTPNEFTRNVLFHENGSGDLYTWNGSSGSSITTWNTLKSAYANDSDYTVDPQFVNTSSLPAGLAPGTAQLDQGAGWTVPLLPAHDLAGRSISSPPIGAYEYVAP